jgi:hypothetical protein
MDVDRDVISDRAVGPNLVVVSAPILQLFAGIMLGELEGEASPFGPPRTRGGAL